MDIKVDNRTVIVFDLDDTLYNEMEYLRSAYIEIAQKLDFANWQALFARMFSLFRSKKDVFAFVSAQYNIDKNDLIQEYRSHVPILHPFNGVLETIERIRTKKGKIGIITDGRKSTQCIKLKSLGIYDLVNKIIISEEIGTEKPDEKNYIAIEEAFNDCTYVYLADNLRKDFISPNKRGWHTIGLVDNGLNMHYDGHKYFDDLHAPKQFISSFEEISII